MAKVKRYLKSVFGARKTPYPKGLEFLKGVSFYAITEHTINERLQKRIEILPRNLKRILDVKRDNEELEALNFDLVEMLSEKKLELSELEAKYNSLLKNYNQLYENVKLDNNKEELTVKSPKNYFAVAEEKGGQARGLPLQGGLPS